MGDILVGPWNGATAITASDTANVYTYTLQWDGGAVATAPPVREKSALEWLDDRVNELRVKL